MLDKPQQQTSAQVQGENGYYVSTEKMMQAKNEAYGVNYNEEIVYYLKGAPSASAPAQTASQWVSDARGWRVQNADGSFMTNQWYQSNNLWYYMGADGYMLTNTTTTDGYQVNADGVWVQ